MRAKHAARTAVACKLTDGSVASLLPRSKFSFELSPRMASVRYRCTVCSRSRFVVACRWAAPRANTACMRKECCQSVSFGINSIVSEGYGETCLLSNHWHFACPHLVALERERGIRSSQEIVEEPHVSHVEAIRARWNANMYSLPILVMLCVNTLITVPRASCAARFRFRAL